MAQTLNLSNPIRLGNANATGPSDSYLPNANAAYGPYANLDAAKQALASIYGAASIPIGVTVAVNVSGTLKEYWNPTSKDTFVAKQSSTSSSGVTITTVENITEDTNTSINAIVPNANVGDFIIDTTNENIYLCYETGKWFKIVGAILGDAAPVVTRIVNANVLSYK